MLGTAAKKILAIHGAGMNAAAFGSLAPLLADYAFQAVTLPGHDERGAPLRSIQQMADWVKERIHTADGQVVLLGHSMGALIALQAANAPGVAGLVLIGAAAAMPVNPDLLKTAHEKPGDAIGLMVKWSVYKDHPQGETVRPVVESLMKSVPAGALAADLEACNSFAEGARLASGLHKPALVLAATHDKMTRSMEGEGLARLMPSAQYHVIAGAGHMMMIEQPMDTANEIKAFLADSPL